MKAKEKFNSTILLYVFAFIAMLMLCISFPLISYAETGSLGQESPEIYCTYEQDGVAVDGNKLTAGTYDVSFVLSGMSNLSVIEITAAYDQEQVTIEDPTAFNLISDNDAAEFDSMGYILSDGNIVFGFVSTGDDTSSVNEDEQIIATVKMTFASDCDAEEYITVLSNPNVTFAQADYGDGYDDEYALVDIFDSYNGMLYLMDCDVTPGFGHCVSGNLVVMTNANGSTNGAAVYGAYTIDIYSDAAKTNLVTSVSSIPTLNENNQKVNLFNIKDLPDGTYYATISYEYAISRDNVIIHINGNDIDNVVIPMLNCDFDKDGSIGAPDAKNLLTHLNSSEYPYMDMDGDSSIGAPDAKMVLVLLNSKYDKDFIIE